jgi:hypothetical protein
MRIDRTLACFGSLVMAGCGASQSDLDVSVPIEKANPIGESTPGKSSSAPAGQAAERMFGGVRFDIPAGWEEKTLSSTMILAEFALPGEAGAGRLTLSSAGGGTAANMDRWRGQFQRGPTDPESTESSFAAAGQEGTLIEVYGTYSDMFGGGGPRANWQLLGVAIPIDADHNYFVKLTGPRQTVSAQRDAFVKFVKSARFDK